MLDYFGLRIKDFSSNLKRVRSHNSNNLANILYALKISLCGSHPSITQMIYLASLGKSVET